jgi:hypothetical protein
MGGQSRFVVCRPSLLRLCSQLQRADHLATSSAMATSNGAAAPTGYKAVNITEAQKLEMINKYEAFCFDLVSGNVNWSWQELERSQGG